MRTTPLALAALTSALALGVGMTARADIINTTNDNYSVDFTPDDGVAPLNGNEFPQAQAQRIADAFSNTTTPTAGNPNGLHNGYDAQGFDAPDFNGAARRVFMLDCTMVSGGCDSGDAPADRIRMPVASYRTSAEACLRLVVGHELFHHIQYESIGFSNWSTWGADPVEGTARVMQDKLYNDLDNDAGCITYLSQVNSYLGDPATTLWGRSYTTALFWNYLMEQLGNERAEPGVGHDFIREFWQNAQDAGSNRDFLATLRATISEFDRDATLEGLFHDFTIANYTRQKDVSVLPDATKYVYVDEQQPGATAYNAVPVTNVGTIPPNVGPTSLTVNRYAAKYLQADIGDCTGVAGFVADGDRAGYALVSQDSSTDTVSRLDKGVGTHFARAILVRTANGDAKRITRLGAVVTGLNDAATTSYRFACGSYTVDIKDPTAAHPAYVGLKTDPNRFIVRVRVVGPSELGTPSVEGLRPEDFAVRVGTTDATVLSGAYVQGEYWLTVQPPSLPAAAADLQDLTVTLGGVSDAESQAVRYQVRHLDQMVTVDRSGSMLEPAAAPKIEAARNAASLYVDAARSDDKLGVVSFSGDNLEPNDDATLDALLKTMTASNRDFARAKVIGLTAGGMTSIGDGVDRSSAEFPIRGTAAGEDWIVLLSDGMENEGRFWSSVRSSVIAAGTKVDTIALGPLTDQALLQQIASDTGGTYYYVDVNSGVSAFAGASVKRAGGTSLAAEGVTSSTAGLANALASVYFAANENAGDLERFWQDQGNLAAGGTTSRTIDLTEADLADAVIAVNWPDGSDPMAVSLVRPDGSTVVPGPGVDVTETSTHTVFRMTTMEAGLWKVKIGNGGHAMPWVGMAAGRPTYGTSMWVSVGNHHEFRKEKDAHRWGEQVPIIANLTDKNGPVTGGRVYADVTHPDGTVLTLPLMDDGAHGDGLADDGVYAGVYTRTTEFATRGADDDTPKPNGSYQVDIRAEGRNSLGEGYQRYEQAAFAVFENGDPNPDQDGDGAPDLYEGYHPCLDATDPGDLGLDPDGDGVRSKKEWFLGTDPCQIDTDRGGEPDGSELGRGSNPFDPLDDALPRPEDPSVISQGLDHMPRLRFLSNTLLIRYPANAAYSKVRLWRATSASGPFTMVREFDSTAFGGQVRDTGLTNGTRYYYKVEGVNASGNPSVPSPVFSGVPKRSPMPPVGHVVIDGGRPFVPTTTAPLQLGVEDADVTQMMVSNHPGFRGAVWEPFAKSRSWTLAPRADGFATVHVKFRDSAGNVSNPVSDEVRVRSGLISLSGRLKPDVAPADGTMDGVYEWLVGRRDMPLARSDTAGRFTFRNLPPSTYTVMAKGAGYRTKVRVTLVNGVVTTVPVTCGDGSC